MDEDRLTTEPSDRSPDLARPPHRGVVHRVRERVVSSGSQVLGKVEQFIESYAYERFEDDLDGSLEEPAHPGATGVPSDRTMVRSHHTPRQARASSRADHVVPGERAAVIDFQAEAARLSLPLGPAPTDGAALVGLRRMVADASDIFHDMDAAMALLTSRPLDDRGRNGIEILRANGLSGILSYFDDLRFGSRG